MFNVFSMHIRILSSFTREKVREARRSGVTGRVVLCLPLRRDFGYDPMAPFYLLEANY